MILFFLMIIEKIKKERRYKVSVYERLGLIIDNLVDEFKKCILKGLYYVVFKF